MSFLDEKGVETLAHLMKKEVKDTVESSKEQLFVVTATPKKEPTTPPKIKSAGDTFSTTTGYTPSVTFEEAVAQARSGKKIVLRISHDSGAEDILMHFADFESDPLFFSDLQPGVGSYKDTFVTPLLSGLTWHSLSLYEKTMNVLPKWIGDTKPTYTASEVGADTKGAAAQALTDAKTWAGTELAKKEDKALYITMTEGDYNPSTGQTPVTFSESYETVLAALQAKKRVLTYDTLGFPAELYFSDLLGGIFGKISYPDSVEGKGIFWSGEQDGYIEEINATKPPKQIYFTLRASDWNSNTKSQTVFVPGVSANESAQVIQPIPAIASQSAYYAAGILATGQAKDHVTFTAATIPTTNLNIYVVVTEVRG